MRAEPIFAIYNFSDFNKIRLCLITKKLRVIVSDIQNG